MIIKFPSCALLKAVELNTSYDVGKCFFSLFKFYLNETTRPRESGKFSRSGLQCDMVAFDPMIHCPVTAT